MQQINHWKSIIWWIRWKTDNNKRIVCYISSQKRLFLTVVCFNGDELWKTDNINHDHINDRIISVSAEISVSVCISVSVWSVFRFWFWYRFRPNQNFGISVLVDHHDHSKQLYISFSLALGKGLPNVSIFIHVDLLCSLSLLRMD